MERGSIGLELGVGQSEKLLEIGFEPGSGFGGGLECRIAMGESEDGSGFA